MPRSRNSEPLPSRNRPVERLAPRHTALHVGRAPVRGNSKPNGHQIECKQAHLQNKIL